MPSREYEDYLRSVTWQDTRALQLQRDGYRCRNCHDRSHLQVHHWYYTRDGVSILGKETPDDLVTLCEACHRVLTHRRQVVFGTGRRRWVVWVLTLLALLAAFWLLITLAGCTSTRDGSQAVKLPACQIRSSGQVSCTTAGMSIPLPR